MTNSSSTPRRRDASREELSELLLCFDADADKAWIQYDLIRRKLIKFFECYNCWPPEEYADEVLDRIAKKSDIRKIRDIPSFAVGIARNLRFEDRKKRQRLTHFEESPEGEASVADPHDYHMEIVEQIDAEVRFHCLQECLTALRTRDRDLALDYYSAEGLKDHEHRQAMAERMGVSMDALRVRMNRIREKLERCVEKCLETRRNQLRSNCQDAGAQR